MSDRPSRLRWLASLSVLVLGPGAAACTVQSSPPASETGDAACLNGVDDDRDGRTDCADPGCALVAVCAAGGDTGPGGGTDAGPGRPDIGPYDAGPPVTCVDPIDLVFVLDVSTSMSGEAAALRAGVASIFAAADALTTDHRFGLVVFVDDALAVGGCRSWDSAAELATELMNWQTFCATNRSPASTTMNSDCQENTLDAMWAAATQCTWRPGATHILIHVTDDTFEEPPYVYSRGLFGGGGVPAMRHYYEVRDALVEREIRVGAFAMEMPEFCGAGTSPDTGRGFFTDYGALQSFPVSTGGRVWDLRDVRDGRLDMATAIAEMIEDEHCTVF